VIVETIKSIFSINDKVLQGLMAYANATTDSGPLSEFTDIVNQHYDSDDKLALLDCLWRVAIADGRVDLYEEQLIARVAGLIGISDNDLRASKARVSERQ
jgi:uncharacterized tellurite resistance protein B-like protein